MSKNSKVNKLKNEPKKYTCTECGKDATVAMIGWEDSTGKKYYKKGERLCMSCHKKRTGIGFFI